MTRIPFRLALALLATAASATFAQSDPALAPTAAMFRGDLRGVTNMVATAALVHDATGAYPTTPFALLGSAPAGRTGLRALPLSDLTVTASGDRVVFRYVPLPVAPYVREDKVVHLTITQGDDGIYTGTYEIRRREAPADGASPLPYDRAGHYRVEFGAGTACVDAATVRQRLASGTFDPEPGTLGPAPLALRVRPIGEAEPVFYREDG